jgi:NADPH:quinone reductase-like Zn-dependent oxidoreductase
VGEVQPGAAGPGPRGGRRGGIVRRPGGQAFGAHVTGVGSTSQAGLVRSIGADQFIDYTREDVTNGSRHWDLVIDTGGHRSLTRLRRALTRNGTLVIVGSEGRGRWMGGFDRNLRAVALSRFVPQRLRMLSSTPNQDDLQTLRQLIEAGKVTPVLDRTFSLPEVPTAIRHLDQGHTGGKVVITV